MYSKGNRTGGNSNKRYARRERSSDDRPVMHSAICSECDKECEVPFKPNGSKPVFCRDCFKNQGDASPREASRGGFSDRSFGSRPARIPSSSGSSMSSDQFKTLNTKLDKILETLGSCPHTR